MTQKKLTNPEDIFSSYEEFIKCFKEKCIEANERIDNAKKLLYDLDAVVKKIEKT